MSHFLHSTTWTAGGLLAVLSIGLMLTARRTAHSQPGRTRSAGGDVDVPAPRAAERGTGSDTGKATDPGALKPDLPCDSPSAPPSTHSL